MEVKHFTSTKNLNQTNGGKKREKLMIGPIVRPPIYRGLASFHGWFFHFYFNSCNIENSS